MSWSLLKTANGKQILKDAVGENVYENPSRGQVGLMYGSGLSGNSTLMLYTRGPEGEKWGPPYYIVQPKGERQKDGTIKRGGFTKPGATETLTRSYSDWNEMLYGEIKFGVQNRDLGHLNSLKSTMKTLKLEAKQNGIVESIGPDSAINRYVDYIESQNTGNAKARYTTTTAGDINKHGGWLDVKNAQDKGMEPPAVALPAKWELNYGWLLDGKNPGMGKQKQGYLTADWHENVKKGGTGYAAQMLEGYEDRQQEYYKSPEYTKIRDQQLKENQDKNERAKDNNYKAIQDYIRSEASKIGKNNWKKETKDKSGQAVFSVRVPISPGSKELVPGRFYIDQRGNLLEKYSYKKFDGGTGGADQSRDKLINLGGAYASSGTQKWLKAMRDKGHEYTAIQDKSRAAQEAREADAARQQVETAPQTSPQPTQPSPQPVQPRETIGNFADGMKDRSGYVGADIAKAMKQLSPQQSRQVEGGISALEGKVESGRHDPLYPKADPQEDFSDLGQYYSQPSMTRGESYYEMMRDPEIKEGLDMKKKLMTEGIDKDVRNNFSERLAAIMGRAEGVTGLRLGGLLGGSADPARVQAQQQSYDEANIKARGDIERDIALKAEEIKRGKQGVQGYGKTVGELKKFDIAGKAAAKQRDLERKMHEANLASQERIK